MTYSMDAESVITIELRSIKFSLAIAFTSSSDESVSHVNKQKNYMVYLVLFEQSLDTGRLKFLNNVSKH